jgi:hypothetical protein
VEGGFGRGLEKVIEYVKKEIVRLNSVGVGVYWTAHVKEKDQVDLFTGTQYTTLTANMSMKYFNAIKNSSHIVAFGYFDRSIEKQAVGDVNPITKKAKERKSVLAEARKLKFRDDAMIADAKSRFSDITDEIDLDADLFIRAIKEAIEVERAKVGTPTTTKATKKPTPAPVVIEPDVDEEDDTAPFDVDDLDSEPEVDFAALRTEIRNLNKGGTTEQKKAVKAIIASTGKKLDEIEDVSVLTQILEIFE